MGNNQSLPFIEPHHDEQWEFIDYDADNEEEWELLDDYQDYADSDWYESLMAKKN